MDGVHPLLVCAAVEWRWCVLLLACTVQWCDPCPAYPSAVLIGTAVVLYAVLLPGVWCVGGVCLWCLCGGVVFCLLPPHPSRGGGYHWVVGWHCVVGGMALKGGCCDGDPPV